MKIKHITLKARKNLDRKREYVVHKLVDTLTPEIGTTLDPRAADLLIRQPHTKVTVIG